MHVPINKAQGCNKDGKESAMSISGINISSYYNNSYKAGSVSDNEQLSGVQEAAVTQEETGAGLKREEIMHSSRHQPLQFRS